MHRSFPSFLTRHATRVALVAVALAGVTTVTTTSAQAASPVYNVYACNSATNEVCVGVYYNSTTVLYAQVQVKLPNTVSNDVQYTIGDGQTAWQSGNLGPYSVDKTWAHAATAEVGFQSYGWYCGDAYVNGSYVGQDCVDYN